MGTFKTCSMCGCTWDSIDDVLADKEMTFCGYQPFFPDPKQSLLLFVHEKDGCGTTIGFHLTDFQSVVNSDMEFKAFVAGEALDCEGRCLDISDLNRCNSKTCPGVAIRELIQFIKVKAS